MLVLLFIPLIWIAPNHVDTRHPTLGSWQSQMDIFFEDNYNQINAQVILVIQVT